MVGHKGYLGDTRDSLRDDQEAPNMDAGMGKPPMDTEDLNGKRHQWDTDWRCWREKKQNHRPETARRPRSSDGPSWRHRKEVVAHEKERTIEERETSHVDPVVRRRTEPTGG